LRLPKVIAARWHHIRHISPGVALRAKFTPISGRGAALKDVIVGFWRRSLELCKSVWPADAKSNELAWHGQPDELHFETAQSGPSHFIVGVNVA